MGRLRPQPGEGPVPSPHGMLQGRSRPPQETRGHRPGSAARGGNEAEWMACHLEQGLLTKPTQRLDMKYLVQGALIWASAGSSAPFSEPAWLVPSTVFGERQVLVREAPFLLVSPGSWTCPKLTSPLVWLSLRACIKVGGEGLRQECSKVDKRQPSGLCYLHVEGKLLHTERSCSLWVSPSQW